MVAELGGEEDGAEGVAVFEVGGGLEGEVVEFGGGGWGPVVKDLAGEGRCGGVCFCVFAWYRRWARVLEDGVSAGGWRFGREWWWYGGSA